MNYTSPVIEQLGGEEMADVQGSFVWGPVFVVAAVFVAVAVVVTQIDVTP